MSRFVFQLEPLLAARRREEEVLQRELASVDRRRLALEERIRGMQQAIRLGKQSLKEGLVGPLRMSELRAHAGRSLRLIRDAQKVVLELAGECKRADAARTRLLEAARRRRVIERLRERRFDEWRKAREKADTVAMDELAVIAAARREDDS